MELFARSSSATSDRSTARNNDDRYLPNRSIVRLYIELHVGTAKGGDFIASIFVPTSLVVKHEGVERRVRRLWWTTRKAFTDHRPLMAA
jgi:hypothetical protein